MRTIVEKYKVYFFNELPQNIQNKVVEDLYSINVSHDWWEYMYEDFKNTSQETFIIKEYPFIISIDIQEFDLDFKNIKFSFEINESKFFEWFYKEHKKLNTLLKLLKLDYIYETSYLYFTVSHDAPKIEYLLETGINNEYEHNLKNNVSSSILTALQNEYDYLISEESIIETIILNAYEFTIDGKMKG